MWNICSFKSFEGAISTVIKVKVPYFHLKSQVCSLNKTVQRLQSKLIIIILYIQFCKTNLEMVLMQFQNYWTNLLNFGLVFKIHFVILGYHWIAQSNEISLTVCWAASQSQALDSVLTHLYNTALHKFYGLFLSYSKLPIRFVSARKGYSLLK